MKMKWSLDTTIPPTTDDLDLIAEEIRLGKTKGTIHKEEVRDYEHK